MGTACSISGAVTYHGGDSLQLVPGETLSLTGTLPEASGLSATVLVPAAPAGASEVDFWIAGPQGEIPGSRISNSGQAAPEWRQIGPFPLDAGPISLSWTSAAAQGSWPAGVEPFYLGAVAVGSDPLSLQLWCDQQGGDPALSIAARALGDPPPPDNYFTSFEESGIWYFLRYISWLDWAAMDWLTYIRQSSDQALNGTYSAQFVQVPPFGASILWSRGLPIPSTSSHVTISFGAYAIRSDAKIGYKTYFDGSLKSDKVGPVSWANGWYRVFIDEDIPVGAREFKFEISLEPLPNAPLDNALYMDDLNVSFGKPPPPPARAVVFGDLGGAIYGVSNLDGSQMWKQSLPRGYMTAPATIAAGVCYVTGNGTPGVVQAYDAQTGRLSWSRDVPAGVDASVALWGGTAYVVASNGHLYGLRPSDGTIVYDQALFTVPSGGVTIFGNVIVDGIVYVTSTRGVDAYDIAGQLLKWSHPAPTLVKTVPTIWQQFIYFGRIDGQFEALRIADGRALFPAKQLNGPIYTRPQLVGGLAIVGTDNGLLIGMDANTGAAVWTISQPGMVRGFLLSSDRVYVVSNAIQGGITAYRFQVDDQGKWTFTQAWTAPVSLGIQQAPMIDDQVIFYTGGDRKLYALESKTGRSLWTAGSDSLAFMTPVVNEAPTVADLTRRYDQCCYLCTHNAYANTSDGWLYAQQSYSLTDQLNDGVRALMLDVGIAKCVWQYSDDPPGAGRYCGPTAAAPADIYLIHENLALSSAALFPRGFTALRTFSDALREVGQWLKANPTQIVTMFLESQVNDATLMQQAIQTGGVQDLIFWADRTNPGPGGGWTVATQGWPTLEWMVNAGKRLVLLSQHRSGLDGVPDLYQYAVENDYGDKGLAPGCRPRSDSRPLNDTSRALFAMNYFVDWAVAHAVWYPGAYGTQNDYFNIIAKVNECAAVATRLPNFLSVDFFQRGDNGGPKAAVAAVDGRWRARASAAVFLDRSA